MSDSRQNMREEIIGKVKKVVIKVGTNVLAGDDGAIDKRRMQQIVSQIAGLRTKGVEVILVTSGAIGAGIGELRLAERPKTLPKLQAAAAVGQCALMREYYHCFRDEGLHVAQVLLTGDDVKARARHLNVRNTLLTLLEQGVIPVVNENDTVSTDEIKFGDNDKLSALVANLAGAQLLIILSNVEGLIDYAVSPDAVVPVVESVTKRIEEMCVSRKSALGTGGMSSKLLAARIVNRAGEAVIVASGLRDGVIADIFAGKNAGTLFLPKKGRMAGRKRWIAFFVSPAGSVTVDAGAERALREGGKSLLASGISQAGGAFKAGDTVSIRNLAGEEFGRGIVQYGAKDVDQIKGLKTGEIAHVLGKKPCDEVIHRDNLVIL
ncbi:MAG TPA: glutamate 5-kinase [bacterium]|nr:glutamate 5-kinase [bacterium]